MVFQESEAATFINENYIPFKIVKNEGDYEELRDFFNMIGFPTIIVLDSDGVERDRIVGFGGDADAFMEKIRNWAQGRQTLYAYLEQWADDTTNVDYNYHIAQRYIDRAQPEKALRFLQNILEFDPNNATGHRTFARFYIALYEARYHGNPEPLEALLSDETSQDRLETAYFTLVRHYEARNDTTKTLALYKQALDKLPDNADMLNSAAWYIHSNKIESEFDWGIKCAERAVELMPNDASIWDTLAWLYHDKGEYEKAVQAMQKAVELAPDTEYFKQTLFKMQTDLNQQQ